MNDPKGGVAKVTRPTFEAMGQIPAFHRTYFLFILFLKLHTVNEDLMLLSGEFQSNTLYAVFLYNICCLNEV